VRNTHKEKVPESWIRKQTLTGAERYITTELKTLEEKVLSAEEKISALENKIYAELVQSLIEFIDAIQRNAKAIAHLDCIQSLANVAKQNNYTKPIIDESLCIDIKNGRHPVIESALPLGEAYVANDVMLDNEMQQIIILTGPNMSGKSALLRQTALIVLMAQIGSYVPAELANIGFVDKIFTRVGASDNLSSGESTFMVEMNETASIINNITDRSLILLDEIGRGTSTYDGISIAWSLTEYLHNNKKANPKTFFATHYHELNELSEKFSRIKNFHIATHETKDKVIFLRKLKPGGSEHSFGIHVAKMAGMPKEIIQKAEFILQELESQRSQKSDIKNNLKKIPKSDYQLSIFNLDNPKLLKIKEILSNIDVNILTPVEALIKLNEIKRLSDEN
jgi:DNA mismatch repair protein MutS